MQNSPRIAGSTEQVAYMQPDSRHLITRTAPISTRAYRDNEAIRAVARASSFRPADSGSL